MKSYSWHVKDSESPIVRAPRNGWKRIMRIAVCNAHFPQAPLTGLRCDRLPGHTGRHASYGVSIVLAVWP